MKRMLLAAKAAVLSTMLLVTISVKAQTGDGSSRTCGSDFAVYNLQGLTLKQLLDFAGGKHNSYLDYIYEKMNADITIINSRELQQFLQRHTRDFYAALNITPVNTPVTQPLDLSIYDFEPVNLSEKAAAIIIELKTLRANYDLGNHFQTITALNDLRERAMQLADFTEAVKTGVPVSIAIFSYAYWYENSGKWQDLFIRCGNGKAPCDINYRQIAGHDISGAVGGAIGGIGVGGAAGAVAGGLLGGSAGSALNTLKQGIICAGGVIGRALSWISSWF